MKKSTPRIALVTGAAKGLGATIATHLAKEGYTVIVHYRTSEKESAKTLRTIRRHSPDSSMIQADITSPEAVEQMIEMIIERYGRLDVLVNNVGNFIFTPLDKTTPEKWMDVMHTNLNATFFTCHAVIPHMRTQQFGRIINVGCVDAARMTTRPNTTPYYIAKTGILMLTKQLAADNASFGITVNCISPGILESSIVKPKTPTGKYIPLNDVARTITFIIDPKQITINGANIEIADGLSF